MARELRNLRLDPPSGPVPSQSPYGARGKTAPYLPKRPQVTLPRYLTHDQENTQRTPAVQPQEIARGQQPTREVPKTPVLPPYPLHEERQLSQDENTQQNPKIWNQLHKLFKAPEQ